MPKSWEGIQNAIAFYVDRAISFYKLKEFDNANVSSAIADGLYYALTDIEQRDFEAKYPNMFKLFKHRAESWEKETIDRAIVTARRVVTKYGVPPILPW